MKNAQLEQVKGFLRHGQYAWPGGYPLYLVTADGAALCFSCVRQEFRNVAESIRSNTPRDGWYVEAQDINYENPGLFCDHCNSRIESAYAEPERE